MSDTTLFRARKIITMDPNCPEATHVAVRGGRILAACGADCADQWGGANLDETLADHVLMPGFVEGHAHMMAGAMWRYPYVGYHDRIDPQGVLWPGMTDIAEVIEFYRMSGNVDYLLKIVVPTIEAYDAVYKRMIDNVEIYDVSSYFAMEELKNTTELPLDYAPAK